MSREIAELHARLPVYGRRIDEARRIIAEGLRLCRSPYLACSFGKDSTAMLHLVLEQKPDIPVRFLKWAVESDLLHDFGRVIGEWQKRFSPNIEIIELSRASVDEKAADRWTAIEKNSDGYFIGLRAGESRARWMTLSTGGVIYKKKDGLTRICPLAWWKTIDVQTYIEMNELPVLSAYRSEGFETRTSSRVPRESVRGAMLAALKQRDIAAYNKLKKHFPEIANYV